MHRVDFHTFLIMCVAIITNGWPLDWPNVHVAAIYGMVASSVLSALLDDLKGK